MSGNDFGDLVFDLGRCRDFIDGGAFADAFELAQDLLSRAPTDGDVVTVFCETALGIGRPGLVPPVVRRYRRLFPRDAAALEWLIQAQWDLNLAEECRRTCRLLLDLEPDNYTAHDYVVASVLELGDFEGTDALLAAAESVHGNDRHMRYQIAVARMMRGEEAEAVAVFEDFLEDDPADPGTYINLMRVHHINERYGEVRRLYVASMRQGLDHEDLHFNMALALKVRERNREALHLFARAIRVAEKSKRHIPEAFFHLGQILRMEGHPLLGLWMLQREMEVDDTQPGVHAEMSWCAEDLGLYDDAVRMARAAVERAPTWGFYQHSLAELLLKADPDSEEAEEIARRATDLEPEEAAGWQVLGRASADRGDFDEAERCFRKAVKGRGATSEDEGWLGLLLAMTGRDTKARPFLERAARVYPFWDAVAKELSRIRGGPLPYRYEVRMSRRDGEGRRWFRVLHVVAGDEAGAREPAEREAGSGADVEVEVEVLGFEIDQAPGVVWDSGPSRRRYPMPPPPDSGSGSSTSESSGSA